MYMYVCMYMVRIVRVTTNRVLDKSNATSVIHT